MFGVTSPAASGQYVVIRGPEKLALRAYRQKVSQEGGAGRNRIDSYRVG